MKQFVKGQGETEGGQAVTEGLGSLQAGNAGEGHGAGLYIVYPAKRYDLFGRFMRVVAPPIVSGDGLPSSLDLPVVTMALWRNTID